MGSDSYVHRTLYADPADALIAIQHKVVQRNYEIETLVSSMISSVREALKHPMDEHPDVTEQFQTQLRFLENLAKLPIPVSAADQVAYVQQVFKYDECGTGNILDIKGVSESGGLFEALPISSSDMIRLLGHDRPQKGDIDRLVDVILRLTSRAECRYFPIYEADQSEPIELCFVGQTVD